MNRKVKSPLPLPLTAPSFLFPLLLLLLTLLAAYPLWNDFSRSILGWAFSGEGEFENIFCGYFIYKTLLFKLFAGPLESLSALLYQFLLLPRSIGYNYHLDYLCLIPLAKLFSFPLFYNLKMLLVWFLNALSGYFLGKFVGKSPKAGFLTGLFFAFSPFTLFWIAEASLRLLAFAPLFILCLLKFREKNTPFWAILAGAVYALSGAYYWFNLVFLGLIGLTLLGIQLFWQKKLKSLLPGLLIFFLSFLAVILPSALPLLDSYYREETPQGQPAAFNFPPLKQLLIDGLLPPENRSPAGPRLLLSQAYSLEELFVAKRSEAIPLLLWILVLGTLKFNQKKEKWYFISLALLFLGLSLGPYLKVAGRFLLENLGGIPLPYLLLLKIPYFHLFYWLADLADFALLFLAVLLAQNLAEIARQFPKLARFFGLFILGCLILLSAELYLRQSLPLPVSRFDYPAFYQKISAQKADLGLIEMPFPWDSNQAKIFQVFHQKRVLGSRLNPLISARNEAGFASPQNLKNNSFLLYLSAFHQGKAPEKNLDFSPPDLKSLKALGYHYLVWHRFYGKITIDEKGEMEKRLKEKFGEPVLDEWEIAVFKI